MGATMGQWSIEQAQALCSSPSRWAAARSLAQPRHWRGLGADERCAWGAYQGTGSEPYEVIADHAAVAFRCTCPARVAPCKHTLALLVLWIEGQVPSAAPPEAVAAWASRRLLVASPPAVTEPGGAPSDDASTHGPPEPTASANEPTLLASPDRTRSRDDKVARLGPALVELDRWVADRLRAGLADPALARYATWDEVAARLVDGQASALANRVRRLGGQVGVRPGWHEHVLAELGILHLLAEGGQRMSELPPGLADGVAVALGWQVRQADVLAGVPERDHWLVAARSDTVEDRIVVRRTWLVGAESACWALVLSFAAHGRALDDTLPVGVLLDADLHRYPGAVRLRALVGHHHEPPRPVGDAHRRLRALSIEEFCHAVGSALAAEPWLERFPGAVKAQVVPAAGGFALTDHTGSLALHAHAGSGHVGADLCASTAAGPETVCVEWSPTGVVPVGLHLPGRSIDLGPRVEGSSRWR